jgi:hypothetical protein
VRTSLVSAIRQVRIEHPGLRLQSRCASRAIEAARRAGIEVLFVDVLLIGVGSRRRLASQAFDLSSDGGGNLGRLFTSSCGVAKSPDKEGNLQANPVAPSLS